mmetsp:Transcript_36897/g.95548  ORF Transcript_36897/g.95548 Transcript_36897/m.95548 type:complete len:259 (-) Transcript_36897:569-1345(-)
MFEGAALVDLLFNRSQSLLDRGDAELAVIDLNAAINRKNCPDPTLYFHKGLALYEYVRTSQDDFDEEKRKELLSEATECFGRAVELGLPPLDEPKAWYFKGVCHARLGDIVNAANSFDAARRALGPSSPPTLRILCIHERAKTLQLLGKHSEAIEEFDNVLVAQPWNARAFFRRAFSKKSLEDFEGAASDFEEAKRRDPHNPYLVVNYKQVRRTCKRHSFLGLTNVIRLVRLKLLSLYSPVKKILSLEKCRFYLSSGL